MAVGAAVAADPAAELAVRCAVCMLRGEAISEADRVPLYSLALYLSAGGGEANPEQAARHQARQELGHEGVIALGMDEAGAET